MSRLSRFRPIALALAPALAMAASAAPPSDDLEPDERLAAGRQALRDNCLMCHAEEMVVRSRLTEKQWATEVDKMAGWGAPVPPELKGPLLEYLVSEYSGPSAAPVPPPGRITLKAALARILPEGPPSQAGDTARGASLYAAHCATCHGPEARGGDLGTCLVEKPVLLRPTDYDEVVRKGRRRMPGFSALLKPEQEADILAWLRTRRFEPPPLEPQTR
jgi:ubiquinol-cytochrome c reductase cytochrome c subunit